MEVLKFEILGASIYLEKGTSSFFLYPPEEEEIVGLPQTREVLKACGAAKPSSYTFCLDVSDACNMACDYCFNKNKSFRIMTTSVAIGLLERMFAAFPDGEKYFVDMSGKGEPLLALRQVLEIAGWCHGKQDGIRREVLPQFVCNGTLLTPEVAKVLQSRGILFGVSLDGDERAHDRHRKDAEGRPTFERVLQNVRGIEFRDYVGCAATLTKDVFPLLESAEALSEVFRTISYRPARGPSGFDEGSEKLWEGEYDRLARKLLEDMGRGDDRLFLCLMNGEDYFGRFLCRAFGNLRTANRCDAGISRFACDLDGRVYGCPAASEESSFLIDGLSPEKSRAVLQLQIQACEDCAFKMVCGGECPLEASRNNGRPNPVLCSFRRHLILLAFYLEEFCYITNQRVYGELHRFVLEKNARYQEDPQLRDFLKANPGLSFTRGKGLFDGKCKRI